MWIAKTPTAGKYLKVLLNVPSYLPNSIIFLKISQCPLKTKTYLQYVLTDKPRILGAKIYPPKWIWLIHGWVYSQSYAIILFKSTCTSHISSHISPSIFG